MPLNDAGALGLLVVDSATASIDSYGENTETVAVDGNTGLDLRVTLSWMDPPTTALSAVQLVNDLDLVLQFRAASPTPCGSPARLMP